jgi:phage terminase large subunit-like protein
MADNIARAMAKQAKDMANGMLQDIDDRFTQLTTQQQQDAEVIEARNGKASLKERLDGIDSVSASKANEVDLVVERE